MKQKMFAGFLALALTLGSATQGAAFAAEIDTEQTVISDELQESLQESAYTNETVEISSETGEADQGENEQSADESEALGDTTEEESETEKQLNQNPIKGKRTDRGVTVHVTAPEGSFPEGTTLRIDTFSKAEAAGYADSIAENDDAVAFDINFFDADGNKVQPEDGKIVDVTFTIDGASELAEETGELNVFHVGSYGADHLGQANVSETSGTIKISVDATEFSPYVILKNQTSNDANDSEEDATEEGDNTQTNVSGVDITDFIKSITLSVNGTAVALDSDKTVQLNHGDIIQTRLNYEIDSETYRDHKVYYYKLPVNVKYSAQSGDIIQGLTNVVGSFTVTDDGIVTFVFNDDYNEDNNTMINTFTISGTAKYTTDGSEDEKKFLYKGGSQTIVVTNPGNFLIDKKAERLYGPIGENSTIQYSVSIVSELGTNKDFEIEDSLTITGDGKLSAKIDAGSFELKDKGGNLVTGYSLKVSADGQSYQIKDIPALGAGGSYELTYIVSAKQPEKSFGTNRVTNDVVVTSDNEQKDSTDIDYNNLLTKRFISYVSGSGMRWRLIGYTNGMDLSGMKLTDTAGTKLNPKAGSIYLVCADGSSSQIPISQAVFNDKTVTFTFPNRDYSEYVYWMIDYYSEGKMDGTKATDTNSAAIITPDEKEWTVKDVTGVGVATNVNVDKNWLRELAVDEEGIVKRQYWTMTATYSAMEDRDSNGVSIADNISAYRPQESGGTFPENFAHYMIATEIDEALKNDNTGIQITITKDNVSETMNYKTARSKGYAIQFAYYGEDMETRVSAEDTETHVRRFVVNIQAPSGQKLYVTKIEIPEYPTRFNSSEVQGPVHTISNYVWTEGASRTATREFTTAKAGVEKYAMMPNGNLTTSDFSLDSETLKNSSALNGYFSYVLMGSVEEGADTVIFRDVLPDGLSIPEGFNANGYWDSSNPTALAVAAYNPAAAGGYGAFDFTAWSMEDRNKNVHVDYTDNILTVTITGLGTDLKLFDVANTNMRYVGVQIWCKVDENWTSLEGTDYEKTSSGAKFTRVFSNTVEFNGMTSTRNITLTTEKSVITKTGKQGSNNSVVDYSIEINPDGLDLMDNSDTLTLTDTITSSDFKVELNRSSVNLYKKEKDGTKTLIDPATYPLQISDAVTESGNSSQTFEMVVQDETPYILEYSYRVEALNPSGNGTLNNGAELSGFTATQDNTQIKDASASATSDHGALYFYKIDDENNTIYLNGAEFALSAYDADTQSWNVVEENFKIGSGKQFDYLASDSKLKGNTLYRLVETRAQDGYILDTTPFYFIIMGNIEEQRAGGSLVVTTESEARKSAGASAELDNIHMLSPSSTSTFYLKNKKGQIDISVKKVWEDYGNIEDSRPEKIVIHLYKSVEGSSKEEVTSMEITAKDGWEGTFTNLSQYDPLGKKINYTIEEERVTGYDEPEISGDMTQGFKVINRRDYTPDTGIRLESSPFTILLLLAAAGAVIGLVTAIYRRRKRL